MSCTARPGNIFAHLLKQQHPPKHRITHTQTHTHRHTHTQTQHPNSRSIGQGLRPSGATSRGFLAPKATDGGGGGNMGWEGLGWSVGEGRLRTLYQNWKIYLMATFHSLFQHISKTAFYAKTCVTINLITTCSLSQLDNIFGFL